MRRRYDVACRVGLGVENMSDLTIKEVNGIYKTKNSTKAEIKK